MTALLAAEVLVRYGNGEVRLTGWGWVVAILLALVASK